MLKKNHRLKREEFPTLLKTGKVSHTSHFLVRTINTASPEDTAFAVIVPKKICKGAVERHKAKRRVYSALKEVLQEKSSPKKGFITLKKGINTISFREIVAELSQII